MIPSSRGPEVRGLSSLKLGLATVAGFFALSSTVFLTSCKEDATWKQSKFKKHELLQTNSDPQMPEILWERIEAVYTGIEVKEPEVSKKSVDDESAGEASAEQSGKESAGKEGAEGSGSEGGKAAELEKGVLPTEFAPLKVYLVEKNRGVLHGINHEIVFGPGGGELDLQDFVEDRKGSFYFAVEFMPDVPVAKASLGRKIFFMSNSVRRHNKTETIGNGCHNYYDITSSFDAAMKTDGYALNTTDLRHVSALAGTFFFVMKNEGKLEIAQLTIKDSSHRALQCRR